MSHAAVASPAGAKVALGALLRLAALPVVGFLAFGIALASGLPSNRVPLLGLTIVLTVVVLGVVSIDHMRPREQRNLLFSVFSLVYLALIAVPVFVFYLGESGYTPEFSPNPVPLTPEAVTRGLVAAIVGYAMLLVGHALPLGAVAARALPQMRREWSLATGLIVALGMIPVGWAVRFAGEFDLIPERAGSGVLGTIAHATNFGIALLAICRLRYRSRAALALMCLLIPPSMLFNFFTGSKTLFLMPVVMVVMAHLVVKRQFRARWVAGFIVVMALFYPISAAYRSYAWGNRLSAVEVLANPAKAFRFMAQFGTGSKLGEHMRAGIDATAYRLNGLGILSVIVRDAGSRVPFQGGRTLVYIPAAYVPRLLWAGKPKFTTGQWVTDHFGYGPLVRSSTGATWMGELFYNFGWKGIVIGMFALGAWFSFLQQYFLSATATIPALLAGAVSILTLCTGLESDLLNATNSIVFNVAPILLTHAFVRSFAPAPTRLPAPL